MTATTTTAFRIHAVPAEALDRARRTGKPTRIVAGGGEPVRCCLRDAEPGEELILFNYEPPIPGTDSPYQETGAVYAHAEPCAGPPEHGAYPQDWRGRPQVLRAYDERGWIHEATRVHDGQDPEGAIAAVLAENGVVEVHSRNIDYGCFMFAATSARA
ncbi:DUF1203 domain-containing protein [Streptomyces sp. NBC_01537]|uniref:DUF1203 domain-containing protein n=1 Tax=Streptomyces sp. NBC_01537 TaxID=2903896 RepID=UPI00386D004E